MGRDKATLPFGDEVLLTRVTRLVAEVAPDLIWVARPGQALPAHSTPIVLDPVEGLGPLAAIAVGLHATSGDVVFITACDMPFLNPLVIQRLFDLIGDADVCVPIADGYPMTMCAVYRRALATEADALVAAGRRRVRDLLDRVHTKRVDAAAFRDIDPSLESFTGCDTPERYAAALAKLGA
jgi:molybdenum cofactor guanylyltransferase